MGVSFTVRGAFWAALAAAFATGISGAARASTIRDDTLDSVYTTLSAQPQYAASGYISVNQGGGNFLIGSGTLVASNWVLTAAHVVSSSGTPFTASTITFGQGATRPGSIAGTFNVDQVVVGGWTGSLSAGNDIALIHLTSSPGVTPAPLYNATTLGSELGKTATIVGYQESTGTGLTGNTTSNLARRAQTNVIDLFGAGGSGNTTNVGTNATGTPTNYNFGTAVSPNIMYTDFDSPDNGTTVDNAGDPSNFYNLMGSGDPLAAEGAQVPGDSGGGVFIDVGGTTYIAGVTSFVGSFGNSPFTHGGFNGFYGDENGYIRVSQQLTFINSTIPEPASAAALFALAAGASGLRRRREIRLA